MSFNPEAIKAAHAAGAKARSAGLPESPPHALEAAEKAAWRKGFQEASAPR